MPPSTIDGMPPATEDRPSTGPLRRRSRRVVKTEDDASTDQQLSETPPPVGQFAPVLDGFSSQTPPPLFAVSKSPPPPPFEIAVAAPPVEFAPEPPPLPLMDPSEMMEVIQPMRILAIGDDFPPVSVQQPIEPIAPIAVFQADAPAMAFNAQAKIVDEIPEDGWTPPPPKVVEISAALASETAQANNAQVVAREAQPPREATPHPLTAKDAPAPGLQSTQNEGVIWTSEEPRYSTPEDIAEVHADIEIEPTSKEGANLRSSELGTADEIEPLEEFEVEAPPSAPAQPTPTPSAAAGPKKPPPPLPPKAPPPIKAAPPPPPVAAPAQSAQKPAALPEPSRRRQRPWWEDVFDDDFIRTMDRPESRVIHREVNFIEQCLGLEKGASILDLACGTGRHAVELSSRGYAVVGYDLSLNMLALAADEAQDRNQKLNFLQGDMREMAFDQVFDGVYSWSTSFGYFDDEKNFDVLVRMQRALRTGGILVLDIINRDYIAPRQPSMVWFEGDGCVCMDEMQVDFFSSRLKVKRTAMFDDGRSREIDYSMRLYNLHEIGKMMHDADFKVLEVTGHPAHPGVFFGSESPRLIIVAERK
jgi:ubiquinone/menaquinone biosynthesis C-methylase UbiE